MSDPTNPSHGYDVPYTLEKPRANRRMLTDTMLAHLYGASPWLRLIGIVGIGYSAVLAIGGLFFFAPAMDYLWDGVAGFGFNGAILGFIGAWSGMIYLASGLFIFVPSFFTYRFGQKIRGYAKTGNERDLELAFRNNKSLWKFFGILFILGTVLTILAVVFTVLAVVAFEGFL